MLRLIREMLNKYAQWARFRRSIVVKILIVLLIIACIAPLFIKGPDGEPIMSLDDWKFEIPASLTGILRKSAPAAPEGVSPSKSTTVYKWQDEDGQWHFSSVPPDLESVEEMELSDINIMDPFVAPAVPEESGSPNVAAGMSAGMTATPDQVREMMETVTNLQETMGDRKVEIDAMIDPGSSD